MSTFSALEIYEKTKKYDRTLTLLILSDLISSGYFLDNGKIITNTLKFEISPEFFSHIFDIFMQRFCNISKIDNFTKIICYDLSKIFPNDKDIKEKQNKIENFMSSMIESSKKIYLNHHMHYASPYIIHNNNNYRRVNESNTRYDFHKHVLYERNYSYTDVYQGSSYNSHIFNRNPYRTCEWSSELCRNIEMADEPKYIMNKFTREIGLISCEDKIIKSYNFLKHVYEKHAENACKRHIMNHLYEIIEYSLEQVPKDTLKFDVEQWNEEKSKYYKETSELFNCLTGLGINLLRTSLKL